MFAADLIVDLLVEIISGAWQSETGGVVVDVITRHQSGGHNPSICQTN